MNVKNNQGFSLVELMVVVAIIGILAAVAIPQFSKFQARSRQSEAKSHLTGIFSAEKAFYAEFSQYYGSMKSIGYAPDAQRLRYNAGFAALGVAAPATLTAPDTTTFAINLGTACMYAGAASACNFDTTHYTAAAVGGSTAPSLIAFVASADGNPNSNLLGNVDRWTIDQDKVIQWAVNGIR